MDACCAASQPSVSPVHYTRQARARRRGTMLRITIALSATLILIVFIGPILPFKISSLRNRTDFWIPGEGSQESPKSPPVVSFTPSPVPQSQAPIHSRVENEHVIDPNSNHSVGHKHHGSIHSNPIEVLLPSIGEPVSAAEKLQCPASVLSFVINATDAKDECEGLRKAFDKTCDGGQRSKTSKGHLNQNKGEDAQKGLSRRGLGMMTRDAFVKSSVSMKAFVERRLGTLRIKLDDVHHRALQVSPQEEAHEERENTKDSSVVQEQDPDESKKLENAIEGALSLNTDYLIVNNNNNTTVEDLSEGEESISHHDAVPNESAKVEKNHNPSNDSKDILSSSSSQEEVVISTQTCCRSILEIYHEECDSPEEEEFNDKRLFVIVCVIALCGVVKSLIRHFKLRWLPEAGGCILVGMVGGFFLRFLPNMDFGFQHDVFLRLMVPPIVFEAALNIDKRSFSKMSVPIVIFAVWGTFMSTILTAAVVYYATRWITVCTSIPFIESLAFGALISSIDPIAVLSVLSSMGMSDKDPIYVLIFGESLLNDGVAIVLFQTLVHFMDEKIVIDSEACWLATLHFLVIAFGSLFVGLACGVGATVYFWLMKGIQTPLVEVLMFLCWAFIPYYICDGVDWSGIVSIVAAGFFMDVYVIGSRTEQELTEQANSVTSPEGGPANMVVSRKRNGIFSQEGFLSAKAKNHIGFVTEINSTLMETAIFAYLGIFLLNKRYHWNFTIPLVAVISCICSRSMMVVFSSAVSNTITRVCQIGRKTLQTNCVSSRNTISSISNNLNNRSSGVFIDARMQIVLIFAGLRGAMSFALVETVPMYDQSTGEGSRYKPELKAMTSACIVFTVFVMGGYTYYLLVKLGMGPVEKDEQSFEMVSLINGPSGEKDVETPWAVGGAGVQKRPNHNIAINRVGSEHEESSERSVKFF